MVRPAYAIQQHFGYPLPVGSTLSALRTPAPRANLLTQDVPLPELFRQAQELAEQAATMSAQEADTRARQAEALRALARCDQLVDTLAFFSRFALSDVSHS